MSTTLRFADHPGFHREVLAGAGAAALLGVAWSAASSSPWAGLQGAAVGLAAGLAWSSGADRVRQGGLGLVAVAAGLFAVTLGAGLWGVAAIVAVLAGLRAPLRRVPLAAALGLALGYAGAWAAARIGMASEVSSWPHLAVVALAAGSFGLAGAVAQSARRLTLVRDPVAAAIRALPPLTGEGQELVERTRTLWLGMHTSTTTEHRTLVEDGVLQLLRAAERLARTPAVDTSDIARRQTELDQRIATTVDVVARDQYRKTRATLDDQQRYAERVSAARERILARMHHGVTTLETFRLASAQLDATAAEREAADARSAVAVLAELGAGDGDGDPATSAPAA